MVAREWLSKANIYFCILRRFGIRGKEYASHCNARFEAFGFIEMLIGLGIGFNS